MSFTPNAQQPILTDDRFATEITSINDLLAQHRHEGTFVGVDNIHLYYEYFLCENATATVVLIHGLSEFTRKYYELAYYLLNHGYNVFLYDQRCHGLSDRLTPALDLIHVKTFQDYVTDLGTFIDTVVTPQSSLPLYLYGHSMGGLVAALYLAQHPTAIKKAVLSAPLFAPHIGGIPHRLARFTTHLKVIFCGKTSKFRSSQVFNPEAALQKSTDQSRHRFRYNLDLRCNEPRYQSTPMSSGWVYGSLCLSQLLKKQRVAQRIQSPLLLLSAECDTVVKTEPHHTFAAACAPCTLVTLPGASHSILTGSHESITEYLTRIFDFYRDGPVD